MSTTKENMNRCKECDI